MTEDILTKHLNTDDYEWTRHEVEDGLYMAILIDGCEPVIVNIQTRNKQRGCVGYTTFEGITVRYIKVQFMENKFVMWAKLPEAFKKQGKDE